MVAAPIGIDGLIEADIGRGVARDDAARLLRRDRGAQRRESVRIFLRGIQPVAVHLARRQRETRRFAIGWGATALDRGHTMIRT